MNTKSILLFLLLTFSLYGATSSTEKPLQKDKAKGSKKEKNVVPKDKSKTASILKKDSLKIKEIEVIEEIDSLPIEENLKFKFYKKNAHASYYSQKFHGRRTASGKRFDNNGYTAAHKKLPFGTKVKVTNEANGKSVIVEITDRGPFSKVREIDLSRKAFMDIASNKNSGFIIVKLEVVD